MSYDIALTAMRRTSVHESNMTSNVSGIWEKALLRVTGIKPDEILTRSWGGFSPLTALKTNEERTLALRAAASDIRRNPEEYKSLEPSNGWGSAEGAATFMDELARAWEENPDADLEVRP